MVMEQLSYITSLLEQLTNSPAEPTTMAPTFAPTLAPTVLTGAAFAHLRIGRAHVIGHFELDASKTEGDFFFERLPTTVTTADRIKATVAGGSCGETTTISFALSSSSGKVLGYFQNGEQNRWRVLSDVKVESGTLEDVPDRLYTGWGSNYGFIIRKRGGDVFASSYAKSGGNDYCKGARIEGSGDETITLELEFHHAS